MNKDGTEGTEDVYKKFGVSTTWMPKWLYRLETGRNGGCPVLAIGITPTCVVVKKKEHTVNLILTTSSQSELMTTWTRHVLSFVQHMAIMSNEVGGGSICQIESCKSHHQISYLVSTEYKFIYIFNKSHIEIREWNHNLSL